MEVLRNTLYNAIIINAIIVTCHLDVAAGVFNSFLRIHSCTKVHGCAIDRPLYNITFLNGHHQLIDYPHVIDCAYACHKDQRCRSFNYWSDNSLCQIFDYRPFRIVDNFYCRGFDKQLDDDALVQRPTNLALHKRACQSSMSFGSIGAREPWFAVDGLLGTNPLYECSHTNDPSSGDNWFIIDLVEYFEIEFVKILPRKDTMNAVRNKNLMIGVTNISWLAQTPIRGRYPICGVYTGKPLGGQWFSVNCSSQTPQTRFVIMQADLNSGGYLCICEVEVY